MVRATDAISFKYILTQKFSISRALLLMGLCVQLNFLYMSSELGIFLFEICLDCVP